MFERLRELTTVWVLVIVLVIVIVIVRTLGKGVSLQAFLRFPFPCVFEPMFRYCAAAAAAAALEIRRVDNSFPDCATRARAIGHGSLHMGDDHQAHLADTGRSWVSWGVSQYWGLGRHNVLLLGNGLRSCGERLLRASTSVPTSSVERGGDKSGWGIPVFCCRLVSHLLRKFSMADAPLCTMTRRPAAYVYIGSPSLIGDCIPTQVQDTNQIW